MKERHWRNRIGKWSGVCGELDLLQIRDQLEDRIRLVSGLRIVAMLPVDWRREGMIQGNMQSEVSQRVKVLKHRK
jgi:hypothetical protein